jgi:hypothetical protein
MENSGKFSCLLVIFGALIGGVQMQGAAPPPKGGVSLEYHYLAASLEEFLIVLGHNL